VPDVRAARLLEHDPSDPVGELALIKRNAGWRSDFLGYGSRGKSMQCPDLYCCQCQASLGILGFYWSATGRRMQRM
jgi:hypothetical protein